VGGANQEKLLKNSREILRIRMLMLNDDEDDDDGSKINAHKRR